MIQLRTIGVQTERGASVAEADRMPATTRWVCHCSQPPILLAIYDQTGRIEIKVGDRFYIAQGQIQAACPRCGAWHTLDLGYRD